MHATSEDIPNGSGLFEVNGHDPDHRLITNVRKIAGRSPRPAGSVLIGASTSLLALLGAGCFYVSWWGQYLFIFAARAQQVPAMIQAGMLDAGMVILSGLSLGLARQGQPARAERVLIQLCAAGSAAMNYLAADDASPRSVIVFTPPQCSRRSSPTGLSRWSADTPWDSARSPRGGGRAGRCSASCG